MTDHARDDLTRLRDVHGQRLSAIEVRLGSVEHELIEISRWMMRINSQLADIIETLGDHDT